MSIFNKGEEIICVNAMDSFGILKKGKTYIVLGHCQNSCCADVGVGPFYWFEGRFRRPIVEEDKIVNVGKVDV